MKKTLKQIIALGVGAVVVAVAVILPIARIADAWADTVTLSFGFNISNVETGPVLHLAAYDGAHNERLGLGQTGDSLEVFSDDIEGFNRVFIEDGSHQEIAPERVQVHCSSDQSCIVSISGVDTSLAVNGIHFFRSGDSPFDILRLDGSPYNDDYLREDDSFEIQYREIEEFDGAAYVIWACGENDEEVCLHLFPEIRNEDFQTEYYLASTVTDVTDPSRVFDKFGPFEDEDYIRGMAEKSRVDWWLEKNFGEGTTVYDVDWSSVDIHTLFRGADKGEYEGRLINEGVCEDNGDEGALHDCVDRYFRDHGLEGVKLQPVGESQGNSSYVSYGDRRFRLTIYDDNFKAIQLGDLSDLYYVPFTYEDATYVDAIDISGTTPESPAIMHSILLEDTVRIRAAEVGGLEIETIEALAPEGAVTITESDGEYSFVFNSNYYDAVVFRIIDADGEEYYLMVERSVLNNWIREESVQTTFYFDADTSYSDYELIATYAYKDGTIVEKTMRNAEWIDDGLGNITPDFETEAGRNLKAATYVIDEEPGFSDDLDGVYFNARKVGTNELIYAGTLVGSGLGVYEPMSNYRH